MIEQIATAAPPFEDEEVYVFPASFGQRRLWFLDQFEPGSPYYNIPAAFRLTGHLDIQAFRMAVNEIVRRHESLRTVFASRDGQPVQVVLSSLALDIPVDQLQTPTPEGTERLVLQHAAEEARKPFDLARGPLLRVKVLRVNDNESVVFVTMHHIISDGWSMGVFASELTVLYASFLKGMPSPLPELAIQYADFSEWQRERLQGDLLEKQLAYWKSQLAGCPELLEFPTDRPRPAVYTNVGATASLAIERDTTQLLHEFCRREGATLFQMLLAGFQALLGRYSGQQDICVGTPIANRTQSELEGLIGLFINTLVIRTDLSGAPSFRQLLQRVKHGTLDAYGHQDAPFEMLLDALQVRREMSHSPLFQVMFILQNTPSHMQTLPGISLQQIDVDMGTSTCDLTMTVSEDNRGLDVSVEYNTDLFDASTIERFLTHYKHFLRAAAQNPEQSIAAVEYLSGEERAQILLGWNPPAEEEDLRCVHTLIEAEAEAAPDAVAVAFQDRHLSYGELNARANVLAHRLIVMGVGPESRVALCLEKCPEMIVGVLGVLKTGGAYVPLDPSQPRERLAFMLEDADARVLLTQRAILPGIPQFGGTALLLDDISQREPASEKNPDVKTSSDTLAYMVYTSGTTGKPKGTMISHRSLVNAFHGWEKAYTLRTAARSHLQMAAFAFDVFSGDFVRALCSGGKLVLCPRESLLDAPRLYEIMEREEVTIAEFVPAVLRNLIAYLEESGHRLDFFRVLIAGSDIWYVEEYEKFRTFIGSETRLINSFGLTEATIDSSYFEAALPELSPEKLVPIGKPFPNTRMYLLGPQLQPLPVGVTGQIYIAGVGLARGYHRRPDLTADRFMPDPFSPSGGGRLYHTGDLGRYLPDGNIEFLGRSDHQVKIRGFRVELGEIETALTKYPAVTAGVVAIREDPPAGKRIVAYVVPAGEVDVKDLRAFLLQKLPEYMVPSAFVILDALPLTPNGKVDRKALPVPGQDERVMGEEYVAPRTPVEEMIAGIWKELLDAGRVGMQDDFFLLGGHSLLATQLVSRLRSAFGVEISLRSVFESPTVAGIARSVETALRERHGVTAPPIRPVERTGDLPLSFAQRRLWFLDQLEPNSPLYNIPEVYRLQGTLDVPLLERCFNEVVGRHENLRSAIITRDGNPVQVILPSLTIRIPVTDLSAMPAARREGECLQLASDESSRPISLSTAPLFRVRVVTLSDEDHVVILIVHHIIADDWSTSVLIREVTTLYRAFSENLPSPLPDLPVQYVDYASWQQHWLQGEVLESQLAYWKDRLTGCTPLLSLPTDRPRPPVQTFQGSYVPFSLSEEVSLGLRKLAAREGVTMFMALLGAFGVLLKRCSRQDDINVGTPVANRNRSEIEGLIGFFVNTLVLRLDLSHNPTFKELLARVREATLGAYTHQDVPFEKLVDMLQPERTVGHTPLFQTMFVWQNSKPGQEQQVGSLRIHPVDVHSGTAKFDLTLFMVDGATSIGGAIEYNSGLFDRETIERWVGHLQRLLEAIVADPDGRISAYPLMRDMERSQILQEWSGSDFAYEAGCLTVQKLFEVQAGKTPDGVAVYSSEGQTLSYKELDEESNRLARYLQRVGIRAESRVGVFLKRSPELVVALLGVLKAGGCYVPLEAGYPDDRLRFLIEDSGVALLLTTSDMAGRLPGGEDGLPGRHCAVLCLDTERHLILLQNSGALAQTASAESAAYVIYTSGSTGKPKGTVICHGGLSNYLHWCLKAYPVAEGNGSIVHSTVAFDATVTALFPPLVCGRSIRLARETEGVDGLTEALALSGDTSLLKVTPAHLELLGAGSAPAALANVRALIIGGENLTYTQIAPWRSGRYPTPRLFNEYGPTETVVGCIVHEVHPGEAGPSVVPIGRPIPNTRAYVLDEQLEPVPVGVPGELYLGGVGVARGYLNRPDLTAERFIADPFIGRDGARMYKTGDLVRSLADGRLECLGRIDEQVKIRGYRVEPGEVEALLCRHEGIQEAVVLAREDQPGNRRLVAYYVPTAAVPLPVEELRTFLAAKLPAYMVPSAYVCLDALPLTVNGKVDRRKLPEPDHERPELRAQYVEPQTEGEILLAKTWSEVLGIDRVGVQDNFFELGGDSIQSIQVVSRANRRGLKITPALMFQYPTIAELARHAETGIQAYAEQGPVSGTAPMTPVQHWFFEHDFPEMDHWNQSLLLETGTVLNPDVLQEAVRHLQMHHDALRLRFELAGNGWQQVFGAGNEEAPFAVIDLPEATENDEAAMEALATGIQRSLDIQRGPVFRVALIRGGSQGSTRLLLAIHHLVVDGVSWRILLEDIEELYRQLAAGVQPSLPPKTTSFKEWAERLREVARAGIPADEINYWKDVCATSTNALPLDMPEGGNTEGSARTVSLEFDEETTHSLLREIPRKCHVEIQEVLLTALGTTLSHWVAGERVLIDLEGHGREQVGDALDVSRTVGWFTLIYPLLLDTRSGSPSLQTLLAVRDQLRSVPGHGLRYGLLRYLSTDQEARQLLRSHAQVSFNYLGQMDAGMSKDGLPAAGGKGKGVERGQSNPRTHILEIDCGVAGNRLTVEWTYSSQLHREATLNDMASLFRDKLMALVALCRTDASRPEYRAESTDFGWSDADVAEILSEINKTPERHE